jgi:hypothetical protein
LTAPNRKVTFDEFRPARPTTKSKITKNKKIQKQEAKTRSKNKKQKQEE